MVEMELVAVRVELPSNTPVLLLREQAGERRLVPIFIGSSEATAIAYALDGVETPRPMTHDLMLSLIEDLGGVIEAIVIDDLRDGTFHARVEVRSPNGTSSISARPSDAVALAARCGCPIRAATAVIDEAGYVEPEQPEETGEDDMVEQFREFINQVDPEDFAS